MPYAIPIFCSFIPLGLMILGGFIGFKYRPTQKITSCFQHFVSGLLIASVAVELIPKISLSYSRWTVAIGFAIGTIAMLLLRTLSQFFKKFESQQVTLPLGMLFAIGVDIFIDGVLIGVSFLAGVKGALLISFALGLDVGFLGLTSLITLKEKGVSNRVSFFWLFLAPVLVPIGAALGTVFLAFFPKSLLTETLAFGVAALLYLAVEELLIEAHKGEEKTYITSMFFLGFLVILVF